MSDPAIAPPQTLQILGVAGRHATMPMLRGMLLCYSFFVYFPINLQGATEQLQAAVRSKAALIGVSGSPALPIIKKGKAKGQLTRIHHISTLQILGDNLLAEPHAMRQTS